MLATQDRYRTGGARTKLKVESARTINMIFVSLDLPSAISLVGDGARLFQGQVGQKFQVEFAEPMPRRLPDLWLEGAGDNYATVRIIYDAVEPQKSPTPASGTAPGAVKGYASSLVRTTHVLHFKLHLGPGIVLEMTAPGLDEPENVAALREALRTREPAALEACLPVGILSFSNEGVLVTGTDVIMVNERPASNYLVTVQPDLWVEALDDLRRQYEELLLK